MTKSESEGLTQLKKRIKELEEQLENKNKLVFMLEEAIPEGQEERKQYVADIALFYGKIFKKKLQHFKSLQLVELAPIGRTDYMSNILRSNINCFNVIDEWMEEKTNEHLGNLETIRNSLDDGTLLDNMKEKYGKN